MDMLDQKYDRTVPGIPAPQLAISRPLAAYIVHVMWHGLDHWDSERQVDRQEVEALANQIAALLPARLQARLKELRSGQVAA
jgi:hypothetical protein